MNPISAKPGTNSDNMEDKTYGKKGINITILAIKQETKLIKLHEKRIILCLGTSVKSAPFIPFDNEIAPKAIISRRASL